MKKILVFFAILLSFASAKTQAQSQQPDTNFWDHVRFGGGLGLSFGDGYFSGSVAPSAIYDVSPIFSTGVGFTFAYAQQRDFYDSTFWGPSVLALVNPIPQLQVSAEFEELNVVRNYDNNLFENENYWYPALYMGLGYRTQNITFGIRYDILFDKQKSIYADAWMPFVRVYF